MGSFIRSGLTRLSEPSSWTALMGMIGGAGLAVPAGLTQYIVFAGAGLCGILGFFLPEGPAK